MRWLAEHREGGELVYRIGRGGDDLSAEWVGLVTLTAKRDASTHRFEADPRANPSDVAKITEGSGQLLLRHLRGKLSLHGAAVRIGGRAVVLLGESGSGKSTLAASLCTRSDASFLADDAIALEGASVLPLERHHWLFADARTALGLGGSGDGKERILARQPSDAAPLEAFVELRTGEIAEPTMTRLFGLEAVRALMPQVVRFVVDEPAVQKADLDRVLDLLAAVPCFRLERPRRLDRLTATHEALAKVTRSSAR